MKEYPLKSRQVALFFIAFTPLIKLFTMPSLISEIAQNDGWISITVSLTLEFLTLFLLLLALKNYDGDFYSFLRNTFNEKVKNTKKTNIECFVDYCLSLVEKIQ